MLTMLLGSFCSAFATGVGALPVLFMKTIKHKTRDNLLALSAGVMVSATAFGLIPASIDASGTITACIGTVLGVIMLDLLEKTLPHVELEHNLDEKKKQSAILVLIALMLHNFPEGASVGLSYSSQTNEHLGVLMAITIGLQNMPEGLIVALYLVNSEMNRIKAVLIATLTGVVEIVGGIIGYLIGYSFQSTIGVGLGIAAGAMLYLVYKELIPESHGHGYQRSATFYFVFGFLFMLLIT
ncbi:ZIP family metal transporter [Cytobacillus sp. Hz8]|uniref:ZIP family metal transporter n=1 Tax=Cytobacillus sp. Hz8 TaxID=3347168 RepID=UPI0035DEF93F